MAVLRTGVHPGVAPRLIRADPGWEDRAAYAKAGGYRPAPGARAVIDAAAGAGLRGRGGAAFPLARKLTAVAAHPGPRTVLVNGEEGEPASVKDRWLLRARPHLVLDGALLAARAVNASRIVLYVSDLEAARSVGAAIAELSTGSTDSTDSPNGPKSPDSPGITVVTTAPAYVAGEETAAVNAAVRGRPAKPSEKPPRPFEDGILVSNAETLANLPSAVAGQGTGSFLLTLGGAVPNPGLYEVPFGVTIGAVIRTLGGYDTGTDNSNKDNSNKNQSAAAARPTADARPAAAARPADARPAAAVRPAAAARPSGYLMGGYFAGLLNARGHDLPLDYDTLRAEGTGLGCAAITVLGPEDCPVGAAALLLAYFGRENAGQCGACFNGTAAMAGVAVALARGEAKNEDLDRLRRWSGFLPGRGACATLDGAAGVAATLLREFPDEVRAHLTRPPAACAACGETDFEHPGAPYAADPGPVCPPPAARPGEPEQPKEQGQPEKPERSATEAAL